MRVVLDTNVLLSALLSAHGLSDTIYPAWQKDRFELNDPNDTFLLAMAQAGEANYLVTGDHRAGLLQRGSMGRTRIVTPAIFCAEAL